MTQLPSNDELIALWPFLNSRERDQIAGHLAAIAGIPLRPDPIEWIEREFWIPELDGPIQLAPYQKRCLTEALSTDSRGLYRYSTIVWSDIKKSAKSTIAAAVAAWVSAHTPYGQVISVANDLKQADSRVAYYYRRALQLNKVLGKRATVRNYKATWDNGCIFEAVPIDPTGEAGGGADMVIFSELWGSHSKAQQSMWCYDDQTEVLTRDGWKKGVDLTVDEIVATVTPHTHVMEWEKVGSVYHGHYQGEMHLYESETFSECVTPNHRLYGMFSRSGKRSPVFVGTMRSDEMRAPGGYAVYYPLTSLNGYRSDCPDGPIFIESTKFKDGYSIRWGDFCEYLGWYLAEGRVKENGPRPVSVLISQCPKANPEKWQRIKELHDRIFGRSIGWRLTHNDTSFVVDSAPLARLIKKMCGSGTRNKRIPDEAKNTDSDSLWRLFDAFVLGDGHHVAGCKSIQIPVGCQRLADDLCEVALKLGHAVSIAERQPNGRQKHPYWRILVMPSKDGFEREVARRQGHWKTVAYDGQVWCPSTTNGLVVVRRKGKMYISGNSEMTLSPLKHGRSFRWVETYAGFTGESPTLEMLYEQGVKQGRQLWDDLPVYVNGRLFVLWNDTPRLPWQTAEYYQTEAATLLPAEFQRLHRNQWVSSEAQFVPSAWWEACKGEAPEIDPNECAVFALDAGVSNDCFAMVGVVRDPADPQRVVVRYARAWRPEKGTQLDFAEPEAEIRRIADSYNVVCWCFDPYQLHSMCGRLAADNIGWFKEFSQGQDRLVSDKQLFDMIRDRNITHTGDPALKEHVQNANAKMEGDGKLRLVKRADHLKIDLAVALSMATYQCLHLNL